MESVECGHIGCFGGDDVIIGADRFGIIKSLPNLLYEIAQMFDTFYSASRAQYAHMADYTHSVLSSPAAPALLLLGVLLGILAGAMLTRLFKMLEVRKP